MPARHGRVNRRLARRGARDTENAAAEPWERLSRINQLPFSVPLCLCGRRFCGKCRCIRRPKHICLPGNRRSRRASGASSPDVFSGRRLTLVPCCGSLLGENRGVLPVESPGRQRRMRNSARLLPLAALLLGTPARAGGVAYDDRRIIERSLGVAEGLRKLVPSAASAAARSAEFRKGKIADRVNELRGILRRARTALRAGGGPAELIAHRRTLVQRTSALLSAVEGYGKTACVLASAKAETGRLAKARPNC